MTRAPGFVGRLGFALAIAVLLVSGTIAGGAAFSTAHPSYDRVVWLERDPVQPDLPPVVRRALFADGRFLALAADGYRAGLLAPAVASQVFATLSAEGPSWKASYTAATIVGEVVDLELRGHTTRTIRVANPETNLAVPQAMTQVMQLLAAAERQVATVAFSPAGLRFWATPVGSVAGATIETLPTGFPLEAAARPDGVVVGGSDLALLGAVWQDLGSRLVPGLAQRYVRVSGISWRISWTLDLDSVGPIAAPAPSSAKP